MYKLVLFLFIIFSAPLLANSKCKLEWGSLKSVQNQLRHNSTEWLRDEERKRHKSYQDCRKGKTKKSKKNKKYSLNKSKTVTQYKTVPKYRPYHSSISNVNIQGKFTGEKQQAWLDYYKLPKSCKRPKTTQKFSKCLKNRDNEARVFEKIWLEKGAPPSIILGSN